MMISTNYGLSRTEAEIVRSVSRALRSTIRGLVVTRISGVSDADLLVDQILADLRVDVVSAIAAGRVEVHREQRGQLITSVVRRVTPTIDAFARDAVRTAGNGAVAGDFVQLVIQRLRPAVTRIVEASSSRYAFLTTASARQQIVDAILVRLQPIVLSELQQILATRTTTTTTTVVTTGGESTALKSIFGLGGVNNVRVDTPSYNYAYEH